VAVAFCTSGRVATLDSSRFCTSRDGGAVLERHGVRQGTGAAAGAGAGSANALSAATAPPLAPSHTAAPISPVRIKIETDRSTPIKMHPISH